MMKYSTYSWDLVQADNKKFWENVAPFFSYKVKSKARITVIENENIISKNKKVA